MLIKHGIEKPYLLYLGALDQRKGLDVIINVIDLMNNKDYQIVLAGKIQSNYEKTLFDKVHSNPNVIITGFVSDYDRRVLMSMAEFFCSHLIMKVLDCLY